MSPEFLTQLAGGAVGLLHMLMACAAWLMLRGPREAAALHLWAAGTLALGLGLAVGGLADTLPQALPAALSLGLLPALVLAAMLLRVLALRHHQGQPLHLGAGLTIVALLALGWVASLQAGDAMVPRSYANAVLIVGAAVTGRQAWQGIGRRRSDRTARWLALTEWLLCAALLLRAFTLADPTPAAGRWDWWLAVGAAALAALFGNLGFLGMVMDSLHRAELQARQAQIDETASREAAEQTAQALQALLAQRDALADEHDSLLQMLAQEIRTPLGQAEQAMQGAMRVLRHPDGASADQVNTRLQQAQDVLGEVRAVLDNTLAAATLLSREAPLVRQEVALDFLVELTLGDLPPQHLDRLTVEWLTDVDTLEVEPGLVRLALRNLLHNAFVHGGPQVNVGLRLDELPGVRSLRMVVADDGPGIPPERLHAPPGPDEPTRRRLGLSLVRQVMDLHGGQLILGNELPRGFVAQLVFPLPPDEGDDVADDDLDADPDAEPGSTSQGGRDGPGGDVRRDPADSDWPDPEPALALDQAGSSGARNT